MLASFECDISIPGKVVHNECPRTVDKDAVQCDSNNVLLWLLCSIYLTTLVALRIVPKES